jgi:hypothetical protein
MILSSGSIPPGDSDVRRSRKQPQRVIVRHVEEKLMVMNRANLVSLKLRTEVSTDANKLLHRIADKSGTR